MTNALRRNAHRFSAHRLLQFAPAVALMITVHLIKVGQETEGGLAGGPIRDAWL